MIDTILQEIAFSFAEFLLGLQIMAYKYPLLQPVLATMTRILNHFFLQIVAAVDDKVLSVSTKRFLRYIILL